jgi:hypothetical protein
MTSRPPPWEAVLLRANWRCDNYRHDPDRRTYADDLARNWLDEASQPSQRHNRPPSRRVSPVRRPTDRLRLATAVNKLEPVYISQSADCRQATDDFLKNRFHTSGQGREFNIFVVIEREVNNNGPHDRSSQKGVIKKEKNERRGTSRGEKSRSPTGGG